MTSDHDATQKDGERFPSGDNGDFQRVDAERMEPAYGGGGVPPFTGAGQPPPGYFHMSFSSPGGRLFRPPLLSMWLCLALAWLFLGSKIPFTVLIGLPLNCIALLLAAVSFTRGAIGSSVLVFFLGTLGSVIVYLVGLFRFLAVGL